MNRNDQKSWTIFLTQTNEATRHAREFRVTSEGVFDSADRLVFKSPPFGIVDSALAPAWHAYSFAKSQGIESLETDLTYFMAKDIEIKSASQRAPTVPISVVIPHKNQVQFLGDALTSLQGQLETFDKLILVDDGSEPAQRDKAESLMKQHSGVFFHLNPSIGPGLARNFGAEKATGGFLFFLDADDCLEPGGLTALRQILEARPDLDAVYGNMRVLEKRRSYTWVACDPSIPRAFESNFAPVSVLHRLSSFQKAGGFSSKMEQHLEDWELHLRLFLNGYRFGAYPVPVFCYQQNTGMTRNRRNSEAYPDSVTKVFRSALASITPERLLEIWPSLSAVLIQHATRSHLASLTRKGRLQSLIEKLCRPK